MADTTTETPIRFFLDEHVPPAIARYLRAHGIGVLTVFEAGRANRRIHDADQLDFATTTGYVPVSRDEHFLNPKEAPQLLTGQFAGIVSLRRTVGIGEQARYLRYIAETATMETIFGQIRFYEQVPRGLFADD